MVIGLGLVVATSCQPQFDEGDIVPISNLSNARQKIGEDKVQIAKVLAKAVKNLDVRALLKEEALKKFDGDYDVLFQLVKNKKLKNNKTLVDFITEKAESPAQFRKSIDALPLLAIYVPTFFSAEKWDVENQVPVVAVRDADDKLIAFNDKGETAELSLQKSQTFPS